MFLLRMVTLRERTCAAVEAALKLHVEPLVSKLAAYFSSVLEEGETLPDFQMLLTLLGRKLKELRLTMVETERRHRDEVADDRIPRFDRDGSASDLYQTLLDWRPLFVKAVGENMAIQLGFEVLTTQDPRVLVRQARAIVHNLEKPGLVLDMKRGVAFDLSAVSETLRSQATALETYLARVSEERVSFTKSMLAKDQALVDFDVAFPRGTRLFRALLLLIGEVGAAERVRISERRVRRNVEESPLEEPPVTDGEEPFSEPSEPSVSESSEPSASELSEPVSEPSELSTSAG